jgi:SAM-dependent methyltransferase
MAAKTSERHSIDERRQLQKNTDFFDSLWAGSRVIPPQRFNTWPLIASLLPSSRSRLEIGPGLCPRLPLDGTSFIDVSAPAVAKLVAKGADARVGLATKLPWESGRFDLVGAFDILEHVDDDEGVLSELSRVAAPEATLLLSVPLHVSKWTAFDDLVGHRRRYEPEALLQKLAQYGWSVSKSAAYGMQPTSSTLLDFVVWSFEHRRSKAVWWYSHVILPLGVKLQQKLRLAPRMMDFSATDEALLVCARRPGRAILTP